MIPYTMIFLTYNHLYTNSNYLILYIHTNIHHDSIITLNYIHSHSIPTYVHKIHVELKIFLHLPLALTSILLHSYFLLYLEHILEHMNHQ